MRDPGDTLRLEANGATCRIALRGAEPVSWQVGGRELLWSGDPAHWGFQAPLLFPVVGASAGGTVRVDGAEYPMPQHGFARHATFELVTVARDRATLRLVADAATRAAYPFAFRLDVTVTLDPARLRLDFLVANEGRGTMPYAIGVHPAFPWPLTGRTRDGHRVVFDAAESADVPEVAAGGLLARRTRTVPLDGNSLPLAPELFTEALVFLHARSRAFGFEAPSGAAVRLTAEGLPHLAVWTKPDAPFVSLEAWSGHADWEGADGELRERTSMALLLPGTVDRHAITYEWRDGEGR